MDSLTRTFLPVAGKLIPLVAMKSALILQFFPQLGPTPDEPDFDGIQGDTENIGDLAILQAFKFAEQDDRSGVFR